MHGAGDCPLWTVVIGAVVERVLLGAKHACSDRRTASISAAAVSGQSLTLRIRAADACHIGFPPARSVCGRGVSWFDPAPQRGAFERLVTASRRRPHPAARPGRPAEIGEEPDLLAG